MKIIIKQLEKEDKKDDIDEDEQEKWIDFTELKDFIIEDFSKELKNEEEIKYIIQFLDYLKGKNQTEGNDKREIIVDEYLNKLIKNNLFTKDEFFSDNPKQNIRISLLYNLYEKGKEKIQKNDKEYNDNIKNLFKDIKKFIENDIKKNELEKFLKFDEIVKKKRLNLIEWLSDENFIPEEWNKEMKEKNDKINKGIEEYKKIKANIIFYYNRTYQSQLEKLIDIINNNENKKIKSFFKNDDNTDNEIIEDYAKLKESSDKIEEVKNFLLLEVIYDLNDKGDEDSSFMSSYKKLDEIGKSLNGAKSDKFYGDYKEIFDKIKEKISNKEDKANKFIDDFIKYFKINKEDKLIKELKVYFSFLVILKRKMR